MQVAAVIETNHETFSVQWYVHGARTSEEIRWDAVLEITAFKRDLSTFDLICLGIRTTDGAIEIDEEDPMWDHWIAMATAALPSLAPLSEWLVPVAFPAFETNGRVIFTRPSVVVGNS